MWGLRERENHGMWGLRERERVCHGFRTGPRPSHIVRWLKGFGMTDFNFLLFPGMSKQGIGKAEIGHETQALLLSCSCTHVHYKLSYNLKIYSEPFPQLNGHFTK